MAGENQNERLSEAIEYLTEDAEEGVRKPAAEVDAAVRVIEKAGKRDGLSPDQIAMVMDSIGGEGRTSVSVKVRLVRSLVPRTTVPWAAAVKALALVRKAPQSLQQVLLRWLVLTFDLLDDSVPLHALYTAVFYYLQLDDLRPTVCQLLCLLTRKEDVTKFRVQKLVEIQRRVVAFRGLEAPLTALFLVYKSFCPHLIPGSIPARRKVWFRPFEKALAADIKRVQDQTGPSTEKASSISPLQTHLPGPPPAKRAKRDAPPIPSLAPSIPDSSSEDKVSVSQLTSMDDLCHHIDSIELPRQMAATLESPLLRHVISVWSHDPSAALRLMYWVQHTLGYELDEYTPGSENPRLAFLLSRLADFADFIQEPISVVEGFLLIFLEVWNGADYKREIFRLLTHLSLQPFHDMEDYLDPLKKLFASSRDLRYKHDILVCLTSLLKNFALFEWPRHQGKRRPFFSGNLSMSGGEEEEDEEERFDALETVRLFVRYVSNLILLDLESGCGNHALLSHASLSFYELVVDLPTRYDIPLTFIPREPSLFHALLTINATALSRVAGILVCCKENFSRLKRTNREARLTVIFNRVVLDFCDALWRGLAFQDNPDRPYPTLLFQLTRDFLQSRSLGCPDDQLSIIHHPALLGYIRKFFIQTQPPQSKLQPQAIWEKSEWKESYLDYLTQYGLRGLVDFIRTFVRTRS